MPNKPAYRLYVDDPVYKNILKKEEKVVFVDRFENADFILFTDESLLERYREYKQAHPEYSTILFATRYRLLKNCKDAVGALYWRKGRPQLLFLKPRLKHHNIVLPTMFKKFEIETL